MHHIAFVLKNHIPLSCKVQILHEKLGKISCIYPKMHQGAQLTSGSLIVCSVEKINNWYRLTDLEIQSDCHGFALHELTFIHDVARICLQKVPDQVRVAELFDFLLYTHAHIKKMPLGGQAVALLRIFLLLDLLPRDQQAYQFASLNPCEHNIKELKKLDDFLQRSWDNFYITS